MVHDRGERAVTARLLRVLQLRELLVLLEESVQLLVELEHERLQPLSLAAARVDALRRCRAVARSQFVLSRRGAVMVNNESLSRLV